MFAVAFLGFVSLAAAHPVHGSGGCAHEQTQQHEGGVHARLRTLWQRAGGGRDRRGEARPLWPEEVPVVAAAAMLAAAAAATAAAAVGGWRLQKLVCGWRLRDSTHSTIKMRAPAAGGCKYFLQRLQIWEAVQRLL